jgi:hypothetical protein
MRDDASTCLNVRRLALVKGGEAGGTGRGQMSSFHGSRATLHDQLTCRSSVMSLRGSPETAISGFVLSC